jgi:hypothetical protein
LNTRASKYVATLPATDPVVQANVLINDAVTLQDQGRFAEADALIAEADRILSGD